MGLLVVREVNSRTERAKLKSSYRFLFTNYLWSYKDFIWHYCGVRVSTVDYSI